MTPELARRDQQLIRMIFIVVQELLLRTSAYAVLVRPARFDGTKARVVTRTTVIRLTHGLGHTPYWMLPRVGSPSADPDLGRRPPLSPSSALVPPLLDFKARAELQPLPEHGGHALDTISVHGHVEGTVGADQMLSSLSASAHRSATQVPVVGMADTLGRLHELLLSHEAVCVCRGKLAISVVTVADLFLVLFHGSYGAGFGGGGVGGSLMPRQRRSSQAAMQLARKPSWSRRSSVVGPLASSSLLQQTTPVTDRAPLQEPASEAVSGEPHIAPLTGASSRAGSGIENPQESGHQPFRRLKHMPSLRGDSMRPEARQFSIHGANPVVIDAFGAFKVDPFAPGSATSAVQSILATGANPLLQIQGQLRHENDDDDDDNEEAYTCAGSCRRHSCQPLAHGAKRCTAAVAPRLLAALDAAPTQLILMAMLVCDIVIVITETSSDNGGASRESPVWWTSLLLMVGFFLELVLRAYAEGYKFVKLWNAFDAAVIVTSIVVLTSTVGQSSSALVVFGRSVRLLRLVRILGRFSRAKELAASIGKRLVSRNKRRFNLGAFDLDLTYITEQIIAMSLPSMNVEGLYRNPIDKVAEFLDLRHPDNYVVVNLCSERDYPGHYFHDRVVRVPFDDHGPPGLGQLVDFTRAVSHWVRADSSRVVAIHCKGGKGRTGTMVASLLLELGEAHTTAEALEWYAERRTEGEQANQGVSGASQRRYVGYFQLYQMMPVSEDYVLFVDFVRVWTIPRAEGRSLADASISPVLSISCPVASLSFSSALLPLTVAAGCTDPLVIQESFDRIFGQGAAAEAMKTAGKPSSTLGMPSPAKASAAGASTHRLPASDEIDGKVAQASSQMAGADGRKYGWGSTGSGSSSTGSIATHKMRIANGRLGADPSSESDSDEAYSYENEDTDDDGSHHQAQSLDDAYGDGSGLSQPAGALHRQSGKRSTRTFYADQHDFFDIDCWGVPVASDFQVALRAQERSGTMASAWIHAGVLAAIAREQETQERHRQEAEGMDADIASPRAVSIPVSPVASNSKSRGSLQHSLKSADRSRSDASIADDTKTTTDLLHAYTDAMTLAEMSTELGHSVHSSTAALASSPLPDACAVLDMTIAKDALDDASKDADNHIFSPEFRIQVFFTTKPLALLRQALLRQVARMQTGSSVLQVNVPTESRLQRALASRQAILEQSLAGWIP